MNIIKDNIIPDRLTCSCGTVLEYTEQDIIHDNTGSSISCPVCGDKISFNNYEKDITIENIIYPDDFHDFKDGVIIEDTRINEWIKTCLKNVKNKSEDYGVFNFIGSGNTKVIVFKFEDEYDVTVCTGFHEASITRNK